MNYVVGITGGIGSGKSAVTEILEGLNIDIVDADVVARIIVEPGRPALDAIAKQFGPGILLPTGALDRAALRKEIFSKSSSRLWLEKLTHPLIGEEIKRQLSASSSPYTVLSSPLLLETQQKKLANFIVVVDIPVEAQVKRTAARDHNDEAQVKRIIAAQMPRTERLELADLIIDNSGSLAELKRATLQLHKDLLLKCTASPKEI